MCLMQPMIGNTTIDKRNKGNRIEIDVRIFNKYFNTFYKFDTRVMSTIINST